MQETDPLATQALPSDPMKTVIGVPSAAEGATQALRPIQCPVCKQHNPPGEKFCVECGLLFSAEVPAETEGPSAPMACLVEPSSGREHPLRMGQNTIGREGTDVLLIDPRVSRMHAVLYVSAQAAEIEDRGSTNGTKVDGQPVAPGTRVPVSHGSILWLGGVELSVSLPGEAMRTQQMPSAPPTQVIPPVYATLEGDDGTTYELPEGEVTLGRRPSNCVVIPDPYVSGEHARMRVTKDRITFTDVGSTNGSLVNGERVEPNVEVEVHDGDQIALGQKVFTLRVRPDESTLSDESETSEESDSSDASDELVGGSVEAADEAHFSDGGERQQ